eukprot:scaffold3300_cov97-Isochrysis_galbana.AAC.2
MGIAADASKRGRRMASFSQNGERWDEPALGVRVYFCMVRVRVPLYICLYMSLLDRRVVWAHHLHGGARAGNNRSVGG